MIYGINCQKVACFFLSCSYKILHKWHIFMVYLREHMIILKGVSLLGMYSGLNRPAPFFIQNGAGRFIDVPLIDFFRIKYYSCNKKVRDWL